MLTTSETIRFENVDKRYNLRETTTLKEFLPRLLHRDTGTPFYALKDLSFSVSRGETLGIIGRNGSGKSTALKLIARVTRPTKGDVLLTGRVAPLIELGAGFHPDLTGRENVFLNGCILGMTNQQVEEVFDDVLNFAELHEFIDMPIKRYSSGMYLRLAFAVAVHCNPDILVVDEGLAVGDLSFQEKCLDRIRQFQSEGVTIIMVSHGLGLIETFCTRAMLLSHGSKVTEGTPAEVIAAYHELINTHGD